MLAIKNKELKRSFTSAIYIAGISTLTAGVLFSLSYGILHGNVPGYKIINYPGIVATRFFSEEIDFWPKLIIMLTGQFTCYFLATLAISPLTRKILHYTKTKSSRASIFRGPRRLRSPRLHQSRFKLLFRKSKIFLYM